ncbi:MAG: MFS transporter [Betaproteobacteria bacterium]|nr:MFS transporter [Betaproteobacteria bacterium]
MSATSFARGLLIFSAFALAFFMSYGLRAINAVLAPDLVAEFSLSAGDLGAMSSAYFVAFSAMQLPLGIWLDRYGSRRVEASLLLVAALGCACFALGDKVIHLWLGRALIGIGMAACLMAALKAFRFWFAAHWQQRLAAWILVCGTSGALVSTVPVSMLAQAFGWRICFVLAAGLLLACSVYLWLALPRDEEEAASKQVAAARPDGARDPGYRQIFASRFLRGAMPSLVLFQGGFLALQTLWAGPWMTQVLKLNAGDAAQALMLFNAALLLGFLWLGWAAPKIAARGWDGPKVMRVAAALTLLTEAAIIYGQQTWAWVFWLGLAAISTVFTLLQTELALSFPARLSGRAYTGSNLLLFGGVFFLQWGFGALIDAAGKLGANTVQSFQIAMAVLMMLQALSLLPLRSQEIKS